MFVVQLKKLMPVKLTLVHIWHMCWYVLYVCVFATVQRQRFKTASL